MAYTYADLKQIFANEYGDSTPPSTGAETRNRYINLARKDFNDRYKWSFSRKSGSGKANGATIFDLASDFSQRGIVKGMFFVDGVKWFEISEGEEQFYPSDASIFYIRGDEGDGYEAYFPASVPSSGAAITYRYYRTASDLSLDADIDFIPYGEAIGAMAVGKFIQSEGDYGEAVPFLKKGEEMIDEAIAREKRKQGPKKFQDSYARRGYDPYNAKTMY